MLNTPRADPERSVLAVDSYKLESADGMLDLRWSPDEVEYVETALRRGWWSLAGGGETGLLELARRYDVRDPYGAERASVPLSHHFGWPVEPDQLTCGAGTTGLLRSISMLSGPGVVASPTGHPDLAAWVHRGGGSVWSADPISDPAAAAAAVGEHLPGLLAVEAPDIFGRLPCNNALRRLARAAAAAGTLLVVDEAQANYLGPGSSAARLVGELDCLVVLRSVSKGYCCGGLRFGYAVAQPVVTSKLRAVAPPLEASALPMELSLALLAQGDVFGRLRSRIAEVKPELASRLRERGLTVDVGHPYLPWLTLASDELTTAALARLRIAVKHLLFGPPGSVGRPLVKLAVPLSAERLGQFRRACADPEPSAADAPEQRT